MKFSFFFSEVYDSRFSRQRGYTEEFVTDELRLNTKLNERISEVDDDHVSINVIKNKNQATSKTKHEISLTSIDNEKEGSVDSPPMHLRWENIINHENKKNESLSPIFTDTTRSLTWGEEYFGIYFFFVYF